MSVMAKTLIDERWYIILPEHRKLRHVELPLWEKERMESLFEHVSPTDILLEIGAEEGDLSGLLGIWCGGIVLFEPNPKVWPNIRAIWSINNIKKPLAYYVGFAANTTEETPANLSPEIDGLEIDGWPSCAYGPLIGDHGFRQLAEEYDATPQIKIDDFLSQRGIEKVDAINIDVEGAEFEVIKGAEQTIRTHKPKIWLSGHPEFMMHWHNQYLNDLREFIKGLGYTEELLAYDHEVHFFYQPL